MDYILLCFLVLLLYISGCGFKELQSKQSVTMKNGMIEDIDPFMLGDEYARIAADSLPSSTDNSPEVQVKKEAPVQEKTTKRDDIRTNDFSIQNSEVSGSVDGTLGYRVQIGMFSEQSEAYTYAERARSKIDTNVYVIYEAPFFRVRVGDFTEKSEAEHYVKILKNSGFKNSWWIRTTINTQ
jgi:cell division septation protein DedD